MINRRGLCPLFCDEKPVNSLTIGKIIEPKELMGCGYAAIT